MTCQVGVVAPELSVGYRFAIAAALVFVWALTTRQRLRFGWRTHGLLAAMGLCMFSFNFYFFYLAAAFLTSGLLAVVFSMTVVLNIVNGRLFLGRRASPRTLRSEEHTSELQSLMRISYAVLCLKKKK